MRAFISLLLFSNAVNPFQSCAYLSVDSLYKGELGAGLRFKVLLCLFLSILLTEWSQYVVHSVPQGAVISLWTGAFASKVQ